MSTKCKRWADGTPRTKRKVPLYWRHFSSRRNPYAQENCRMAQKKYHEYHRQDPLINRLKSVRDARKDAKVLRAVTREREAIK